MKTMQVDSWYQFHHQTTSIISWHQNHWSPIVNSVPFLSFCLGMPFSIKKNISPNCSVTHLGVFSQLLHLILRPTRHWRQLALTEKLWPVGLLGSCSRGWRPIHGSKKLRQNARFTKKTSSISGQNIPRTLVFDGPWNSKWNKIETHLVHNFQ